MTKHFQNSVSLFVAVVAIGALGWFMNIQAPPGYVPHHLQAAETPGPLRFPGERAFQRRPTVEAAIVADAVIN